MYDYFKGHIEYITDEYVVIESQKIGYRIYTSRFTIQDLNLHNDDTILYTKLIVKEDDMKICGFSTRRELDMFEHLTSVSGVGTKVGLGILGSIDVNTLIYSITNEEVNQLVKAPGVGKKTAQRIILELKDKVLKNFEQTGPESTDQTASSVATSEIHDDVIYALMALGYTKKEAAHAVDKVGGQFDDIESGIKEAFKYLV